MLSYSWSVAGWLVEEVENLPFLDVIVSLSAWHGDRASGYSH
jgi:hypothetical protein